jgi:hypothetical protein
MSDPIDKYSDLYYYICLITAYTTLVPYCLHCPSSLCHPPLPKTSFFGKRGVFGKSKSWKKRRSGESLREFERVRRV